MLRPRVQVSNVHRQCGRISVMKRSDIEGLLAEAHVPTWVRRQQNLIDIFA